MQTEVTKFKELAFDDIKNQLSPNLNSSECDSLLRILNEYRDCVATNLTEVCKTNVSKMSISLTDNEPITYYPYRMAFTEHEKEKLQELMKN